LDFCRSRFKVIFMGSKSQFLGFYLQHKFQRNSVHIPKRHVVARRGIVLFVDNKPPRRLLGTRPIPHWTDRLQNFLNIVVPSLPVHQMWSELVGVCRSYSRKIAIFRPKVITVLYRKTAHSLSKVV